MTTQKLVLCGTDGRLLLSGFQAVVTLTLYWVIRHTVMHQSSTSIYIPYFIEIGKTFCGRTNHRDPSKFKVTWHINQDKYKNVTRSKLDIVPAPIINGGADRPWKVQFSELQKPRDLDLELGHTAYHCASIIDLYLHTTLHWNQKNFLWTDARTYLLTDGHFHL